MLCILSSAPVYINSTFSCVIEKCPPLAVLTSTPGVTLEVSMKKSYGYIIRKKSFFEKRFNCITKTPIF